MRSPTPLAISVVAALALLAPASVSAAPKVTKAGPAPVVLPAGAGLSVKASSTGAGKLGLVLAASATSAKGGVALGGKGAKVKGKAKGVSVKGTLPKDLPAGQKRFVLVCASAATAVSGGKASCKSAGQAPTSGPGLDERLAAAASGGLSAGKAAVYALYAANSDPRLPAELAGATASTQGTEELIRTAVANIESYPKDVQRQLAWFFAPPSTPGSPWRQKRVKKKPKQAVSVAKAARAGEIVGPTATGARAANCAGYSALSDTPYGGKWAAKWIGVPTADGKAIVWYQEGEGDAQASARLYAGWLPEIWKKLSAEFGEPRSDKPSDCYSGPDGRFDIYVNSAVTFLAGGGVSVGGSTRNLAVTMPYPAAKGKWCTDRPSWVAAKPGLSAWAIAHEFMHAIQFSHKYASCDQPISWWDEGSATWAADFVYPGDDYEKTRWPEWVTDPLGQSKFAYQDYDAYPFWMFLQRSYGTGVLRSIFDGLRTKGAVAAVDGAIPGGLAEQWPKFALQIWNQNPIGADGFPIKESFSTWDKWSTSFKAKESFMQLEGAKEKFFDLPIQNGAAAADPLSIASYDRWFVTDDDVREIKFENKLKGAAAGQVQAMLRLKDGSWKLKTWTGQDPVLCRDNPDEDVQELIIVSTNAGPTGSIPSFTHRLRARNACERPTFRIVGYSQKIVSDTSRGHGERVDVWNGTPGEPVTVDPCPDGYCDPEAPISQFETRVTTSNPGSYVTGPPSTSCPGGRYDYPEQTYDNPGRLNMEFDPRGEVGDAKVTLSPQIASVGDVNLGICGAYSTGRDNTPVIATVPREQVLSGQRFTFNLSRSATITADSYSATPTISYTWTKSVTMVRVNEDGSPYGS